MGIIGGCLSVFIGWFYSTEGAGGPGATTFLIIMKFCMIAGGIIAIIGGSKADSDPKTSRVLLILGGILAFGNLLSIIAGILVKEDEFVLGSEEGRVIEQTSPLGSNFEFCANCGARIPRGTKDCEFCGKTVE